MTLINVHIPSLPNRGMAAFPNAKDAKHSAVIVDLAAGSIETRAAKIESYADAVCETENGQLKHAIQALLPELHAAEADDQAAIDGLVEEAAGTRRFQSVTSSAKAVVRDGMARATAWGTGVLGMVLVVSETKLLSTVVVTSGVLGLRPDSLPDLAFSAAFASAPVAWAALKCATHEALSSDEERSAHLASLTRSCKQAIGIWLTAFTFVFGPSLVRFSTAVDDGTERTGLYTAAKTMMSETQQLLGDASWLFSTLLVCAVLYATSNILATIYCAHRESARKALKTVAVPSELRDVVDRNIAARRADKVQISPARGALEGILAEIAQANVLFKAQLAAEVTILAERGRIAGLAAILAQADPRSESADVLPLFSRR